MRELNVVLPGLIWPNRADFAHLLPSLNLPNLAKLLGRAGVDRINYAYSDFVYAPDFEQSRLAASWAAKLGVIGDYAGYLLVEPTHLRADRDRLLIAEAELLQLNKDEALTIIAAVNQHFLTEFKLYYVHDELWLLGTNLGVADLISFPIVDIVGENIDEYLPTGDTRLKLHQWLNEIQMLLFNLPLNSQRQAAGLLAVNSLWLWDKQQRVLPFALGNVLSSQRLAEWRVAADPAEPSGAKGVDTVQYQNWQLTGVQSISELAEQVAACDTLIIDQAYYPSCYRDSYAWISILHEFEHNLIPLLGALLSQGKFQGLNLWVPSLSHSYQFQVRASDKWKFWRNCDLFSLFSTLTTEVD